METAPLTLAHSHARNAALETHRSNVSAASEEHELAAGEFAIAAEGTADAEAQRVLRLLEKHHAKLGKILKSKSEKPALQFAVSQTPVKGQDADISSTSLSRAPSTSVRMPFSSTATAYQAPGFQASQRVTSRDVTSSIASNLATARGIPATTQARRGSPASPTLSAQTAGGKMSSPHGRSKLRTETKLQRSVSDPVQISYENALSQSTGRHPSRSRKHRKEESYLPPISESKTPTPSPTPSISAPADTGFHRFYSTFENLFTKLSAPLAFAGLPLTDESATSPSRASVHLSPRRTFSAPVPYERQPSSATIVDPDMTQLFSPAALRAIRESNGPFSNAAESFYVVPTTGGTLSYAGIVTRHNGSGSISSDRTVSEGIGSDDFVDARETLQQAGANPSSPTMPRHKRSLRGREEADDRLALNAKTPEELQLENQGLRHLVDTLANRVHMWESNAQESHKKLQASLRALQPPLPTPPSLPIPSLPTATSAASATGTEERLRELEERLRITEREAQKLERENDKLKGVVGRYRERWEKLKEGARVRREGQKGGGNNKDESAMSTN